MPTGIRATAKNAQSLRALRLDIFLFTIKFFPAVQLGHLPCLGGQFGAQVRRGQDLYVRPPAPDPGLDLHGVGDTDG